MTASMSDSHHVAGAGRLIVQVSASILILVFVILAGADARTLQVAASNNGQGETDSSSDYLKMAEHFLTSGLFEKAIECYSQAIDANPQDARPYCARVHLYFRIGDNRKAADDCTKIIELSADTQGNAKRGINDRADLSLAYYHRSMAYSGLKEYDKAFADCAKAIEVDPLSLTRGCYIGYKWAPNLNFGGANKAVADYTKVIESNPSDFAAYINRGDLYCSQQVSQTTTVSKATAFDNFPAQAGPGLWHEQSMWKYRHAAADYAKAIELNPRDVGAYLKANVAWERCGQVAQAAAAYEKAAQLDPRVAKTQEGADDKDHYAPQTLLLRIIDDCSKAIELDPHIIEAYLNRGAMHGISGQNHLDENNLAVADLTKAIELNPKDSLAYYNRSRAYEALAALAPENRKKAIDDEGKLIALNPKNPYVYCLRAEAYKSAGLYAQAIEDFSKAIVADAKVAYRYDFSTFSAFANISGTPRQRRGEIRRRQLEIIAQYTSAIAANPNDIAAYRNRALMCAQTGSAQQALDDYTRIIALDAKAIGAYYNRGELYRARAEAASQKDAAKKPELNEQAIEDYAKVIELNPRDVDAYNARGDAYNSLGQYQKAIDDYSKAIELSHGSLYYFSLTNFLFRGYLFSREDLTYAGRSRAYERLGQFQRAANDRLKSLEFASTFIPSYTTRGAEQLKSLDDYSRMIELNAKDANAYYNRSLVNLIAYQCQQAQASLSLALKYNHDQSAICGRAVVLGVLGQYDKAIDELTTFIRQNQNDATSYCNRGFLYWKLGQYKKAIEDCSQSISLEPKLAAAYACRALAYAKLGENKLAAADRTQAQKLGYSDE